MRRWRPAGDAALLLEAQGVAARLAVAILTERVAGVVDVVPGAQTVLVTIEPGSNDVGELAAALLELPLPPGRPGEAALAEIAVVYDGPDLGEVAELTGLSPGEVVARHTAGEYTVGWLGFSPGFGYLTGLDPVLASVPRLAEPRLRVPAGSVAIAGGLAAVYPSTSPGGWRLLGRASAALWDSGREPPALLSPGMRVRFRQVDPGVLTPPRHTTPATSRPGDRKSGPVIEVIRPGPLATVQDLGRPGYGHLGVPHSGAADAASLRLANRLAGNPDGAAGIELTLGRAVFRFHSAAVVAVDGAPLPLTVEPGTEDAARDSRGGAGPSGPAEAATDSLGGVAARDVPHGSAFEVPAGAVLRLGAPAAGLRSYLAVRGGVGVPAVLGSRSADLRSGLGPAALRPGDVLPVGDDQASAAGAAAAQPTVLPVPGEPAVLRVIPGPRDDWFAPDALRQLCARTYVVTPASDRTGLRLDGPALPSAGRGELLSEGVAAGALQVPHGGKPILLLADHPVTGGYPVIATVLSSDIGLAAQLRPGSKLRFALAAPGR
ncbi:MAG TPA: urea amidolyase family protein [Streptosporangiaceae bacterium]|nr:urea amidolyase family protein [Streptosporangiaceae bacterium]